MRSRRDVDDAAALAWGAAGAAAIVAVSQSKQPSWLSVSLLFVHTDTVTCSMSINRNLTDSAESISRQLRLVTCYL